MIHHTRESMPAPHGHSQFEATVRASSADLYCYASVLPVRMRTTANSGSRAGASDRGAMPVMLRTGTTY